MLEPYIHIPFHKIKDYLSFIANYKINLEIYFNSDDLDSLTINAVKTVRDSLGYNPSITVHGPFMDLCPGAPDPKVRAVAIERYTQTLELTVPLKPKNIVFHSGYEKWRYGLKPEIWLEGSLITWGHILKIAPPGTKIAIENIFEDEPSSLRLLMEKVTNPDNKESVTPPFFGICFDTGHFNLFSKKPLSEWLQALLPYIMEFHLHDNDKTGDSHYPIGEGTFNFDELFTSINASIGQGGQPIYTIEAHTPEHVIRSMSRFKEYAQRFLT